MTDEQEYYAHVEALFTKPFLTEDELLLNLTRYWPGEASDTLQGLLERGLIERSPTGRYRLPLPEWIPAAQSKQVATESLVQTPATTPPQPIHVSAPPKTSEVLPAPPAITRTPGLPPLRLSRPAVLTR